MTEMVAPKLGEKVLDPACGTGGFLVNSIEFIKEHGGEDSLENMKFNLKSPLYKALFLLN
jgi:type I restriction-modification system DNA methylase subunit